LSEQAFKFFSLLEVFLVCDKLVGVM